MQIGQHLIKGADTIMLRCKLKVLNNKTTITLMQINKTIKRTHYWTEINRTANQHIYKPEKLTTKQIMSKMER